MVDKSNEIFTLVANRLREDFENITVLGESIDVPSKFPTATIDEVMNIPVEKDSRPLNKYAHVTYRIQVFSNAKNGKRAEARKIYSVIDEVLQGLNMDCKMFDTIPEIYNSKIYQITSTYEAVVREDGTIYRKN